MSLGARIGIAVGGIVITLVILFTVFTLTRADAPLSADPTSSLPPTGSDASATPLSTPTPLAPTLTPSPPGPGAADPGSPDPAPTATTASLILAAWQADEDGISASAFVQDIVEQGGTCVLHAQLGDVIREATAAATPTGQNVSCGFILIPSSELTPGDWTIWFDYSSPTTVATSGAVTLGYDKDQ